MAASIPTGNGGGMHGHVGMLLKDAKYITFLHSGAQFIIPTNPGLYPTIVNPNDAVVRARQVAEHRQKMVEFETYLGVTQALRLKIEQTIDPNWLEAIQSQNPRIHARDFKRNVGSPPHEWC